MADVEKVIAGLEQFIVDFKPFCGHKADWQRVDDALALLKSQEPGKVNITITQSDGWKEGNCPFCGMKVDSFYNWSFCGTCGRGLKWE